jgi:hypothetical protein
MDKVSLSTYKAYNPLLIRVTSSPNGFKRLLKFKTKVVVRGAVIFAKSESL